MYRWETMAAIAAERALGIVRTHKPGQAAGVGRALLDGGMRVVEVALTTPDGLDAVRELAGPDDGRVIGAGTVLDAETARLAVLAGATFLVSPTVVPEVIVAAHRYGVAAVPGAQTPTEVMAALTAGADAVKLFPAGTLGPAYLRAVRAALPQAPVIPTGGVNADNAAAWLQAGAVAVGAGGSLTTGDAATVSDNARRLLAAVRSA